MAALSEQTPRIGIIGAMPPEIAKLKANVTGLEEVRVGEDLTFFTGRLGSKEVVFCSSGVGMVFAAATATCLVNRFKVRCIVFTGVAGGLKTDQKVGDIVLGTDVVNYDMDVTRFQPFPEHPGFKRGQIPFVDWLEYPADETLLRLAREAPVPEGFPNAVRAGRIVTGSEFVTVPRKHELAALWEELGQPEAVEMECAAVAQVCRMFAVPFLGLRALSDTMSGDANEDFNQFTQQAADNLFHLVSHIAASF